MSRVVPFGEAAFLVETGDAETAHRLRQHLLDLRFPVVSLVPGRSSLLVELDPLTVEIDDVWQALDDGPAGKLPRAAAGRDRQIPVILGDDAGPDLGDVASLLGTSPDEVIRDLLATDLRVLFSGFAPGFGYLSGLPERFAVPRLATPRTRTPAGSLAIADGMAGIYPAELPGGWRVVGRTPVTLFDPHRDPPAYLAPGDRVRLSRIDPAAWDDHAGAPDDW